MPTAPLTRSRRRAPKAAALDPRSGEPLYRQAADHLVGLIRAGTFRVGDRVPSVRALSRQLGVSITTVVQAYQWLESQGEIEARPQSGFYVSFRAAAASAAAAAPRFLPAPTTPIPADFTPGPVQLDEWSRRVLDDMQDARLVPLGAAVPDPQLIPIVKLNRMIASSTRRARHGGAPYSPLAGVEALRGQVARRAIEMGVALAPDDVFITNGASEAIALALRAVAKPGDVIAVESPTFYGHLRALEVLGLRIVGIPSDPVTGLSLDALELALGELHIRAVLSVATYSNPLGASIPEASRRRLVELLAAHNVPLIEDDIYGDLCYAPRRPRAIRAFDSGETVILCSSFSKTLVPGWRIGWIVPGRWRDEVERIKRVTTISTNTPLQMALAEFLDHGGYDRHLRKVRGVYRDHVTRITQLVAEHFPEGTRMTHPEGGFVVWIELPGGADSLALYERARAQGIAIAPGPLFSARGEFRSCLRLNAATCHPRLDGAIVALGRLASQLVRG